MSFVFDTVAKAYARIRPEITDERLAILFGRLLEELHEANHRLKDAVNHDARVRKLAQRLDDYLMTGKIVP